MTTPTLMYVPDPILNNPSDESMSAIMFFLKSPGNISTLYDGRFVSFRELIAKHGNEPDRMKIEVQRTLATIINGRLGTESVTVKVELKEDTGRGVGVYGLGVSVWQDGHPILDSNLIVQASDGTIDVKLKGNELPTF